MRRADRELRFARFSFFVSAVCSGMRSLIFAPFVLLAACGPAATDPGPGGVTVGEAQALDEAAEMLEQQRLPPGALPTPSPSATASAGAEGEGE